jgi:glutamine transport system substrate-binding protein
MAFRRLGLRFAVALALLLALPAVAADLDEIKARGELRHLGIRYANFVTGAGDGLDVELVQGFARHLGVAYRLVYSDFYTIIRDLLGKDVVRKGESVALEGEHPVRGDMIAAGFTVLPWRTRILQYSEPTFPSQVLLIAPAESAIRPIAGSDDVRRDIRETKGLIGRQSLLVMENTCLDPANYGLQSRGIELRAYTKSTNINEMVPALLSKSADLSLLDVPDVIIDMRKWAGQIKIIGPISEEQSLAAAFPRNAPALRRAFDEYLRQTRADGTYAKLVAKYYPGIQLYFPAFFARYASAPGR